MYEVVKTFQCENSSTFGDDSSDNTIKTVTIAATLLSLLGSTLIVVAHLLTNTGNSSRLILVHLSLANFLSTSWNWLGLWLNYKHYPGPQSDYCAFCVAQASLSTTGLNLSTFWCFIFMLHYYLALSWHKIYNGRAAIYGYFASTWIITLMLTSWLLFDHWFGYRPGVSIPYCTIRLQNVRRGTGDGLGLILGNDCWFILSCAAIILLYLGVKYQLFRKTFINFVPAEHEDFRFLYVPLAFPLLRVWRVVMDLMEIFHSEIPFTIKVLATLGDNIQGFVNFILFCLCEKELRENVRSLCEKRRNMKYSSIPSAATNQPLVESSFVESPSTQQPTATGQGDNVALLTGVKV